MRRVLLARAWQISPAEVGRCTLEEIDAMWTVLSMEAERRERG